jgi:hypothetical protein
MPPKFRRVAEMSCGLEKPRNKINNNKSESRRTKLDGEWERGHYKRQPRQQEPDYKVLWELHCGQGSLVTRSSG